MKKFCESCAMPLTLKGISNNGSELSGKSSEEYCKYCFENGSFIEPNITYDEMLIKGTNGIKNGTGNKLNKYFMIKFYPRLLKKTKRWSK